MCFTLGVGLSRDDLENWYVYGIYPRTRTLYLGGVTIHDGNDGDDPGICWNTARRLIMGLHLLDSTSGDSSPITIIMNSCGGDWSHGMAIFDAINACKNHVTIINMSHARSMSSIIFQAADYRITAPSGYYMIHDGTFGIHDAPRTVASWVEHEVAACLPRMYAIYLKRLRDADPQIASELLNAKLPEGAERVRPSRGITIKHVQQLCSRDTIFTPDEMIKLNLADRLLETNDLAGAYANPKMHGLPTGLDSLEDE